MSVEKVCTIATQMLIVRIYRDLSLVLAILASLATVSIVQVCLFYFTALKLSIEMLLLTNHEILLITIYRSGNFHQFFEEIICTYTNRCIRRS